MSDKSEGEDKKPSEAVVAEPQLYGGEPEAAASDKSTAVKKDEKYPQNVLLLPLSQIVIFPDLMMPVLIDEPSLQATLEQVRSQKGLAGFVLKRPDRLDGAGREAPDFHDFGTLARIVKTLRLPDGKLSAVVQGVARLRIERVLR